VAGNGVEVSHKQRQTLKRRHCTELSYRITISRDTFDESGFADAIGRYEDSSNGWRSVTLGARNPKQTDYHLHVYWKTGKLQVDYHVWEPESEETHTELYAENFFHWVRQFFKVESVAAHIHGEFEFPVEKWQAKILALPIRVPYGEKTAEIGGLSIKLPPEPHGVHDAWMVRGKKTLDLQLYADRQLAFKNFSPHGDVDAFISVTMDLIQEKKT